MQHKEIQGVTIPEIGLGTYQMHGQSCVDSVLKALDLGYRHIDTAQIYENEREVGEALNISTVEREDVFLTTKIWRTNLEHEDVLRSTEESLKQLQTPYVDLLLIHWPNEQVDLRRTLEAMLVLRDQAKAMNIGVSNFPLSLLKEAVEEIRAPIFCNQIEFHAHLDQLDQLDYAIENDLLLTAYSPLGQGKITNDLVLRTIADKHGKTSAQVALRWLIEQESVVAIPKASGEDHLKENIDVFDFELSDQEFEEIDAIEKGKRLVNPSFAPAWD